MIHRSDESALKKSDEEGPLPPGAPRPMLPTHDPGTPLNASYGNIKLIVYVL